MKPLFTVLVCCIVAVCLVGRANFASADTIDSSTSYIELGIALGLYLEEDDPSSFAAIAEAVGQEEGSPAPFPTGSGAGEVLGDDALHTGRRAQLSGNLVVNPGGFSLGPGSTINLENSGLWQPGTVDDGTGLPLAAPIGVYLDLSAAFGLDPDSLTIFGVLQGLSFDITLNDPGAAGGGVFADASATIGLSAANLIGYLTAPDGFIIESGPQNLVLDATSETVALGGTYAGGSVNLPIDTFVDIPVDVEGLTFIIRVNLNGVINTVPVPEPSSMVLMGFAVAGLGVYGYRRGRK